MIILRYGNVNITIRNLTFDFVRAKSSCVLYTLN